MFVPFVVSCPSVVFSSAFCKLAQPLMLVQFSLVYFIFLFGVSEEQFLLLRLANSAIDTYIMIVVLSRATRSLQKQLPTADHEALMVDIICNEKSEQVQMNLGALRSGEKLTNFDKMQTIARQMGEAGGAVQLNPLNV